MTTARVDLHLDHDALVVPHPLVDLDRAPDALDEALGQTVAVDDRHVLLLVSDREGRDVASITATRDGLLELRAAVGRALHMLA
jgi:hypothetical protein